MLLSCVSEPGTDGSGAEDAAIPLTGYPEWIWEHDCTEEPLGAPVLAAEGEPAQGEWIVSIDRDFPSPEPYAPYIACPMQRSARLGLSFIAVFGGSSPFAFSVRGSRAVVSRLSSDNRVGTVTLDGEAGPP